LLAGLKIPKIKSWNLSVLLRQRIAKREHLFERNDTVADLIN
jgi:hypothetical protein